LNLLFDIQSVAGYRLPHPGTVSSLGPGSRPYQCEHVFVPCPLRFTEEQLREAIAASRSWAETLRRLNYRTAGGNWRTLKKYAALWQVPTEHFDPDAVCRAALESSSTPRPLQEILVEDSSYSRDHLKHRLFVEGLKQRRCELCGQGVCGTENEWL
jgi:hypothetical protein